jgi:serine/threonine protein kinase/Tfp pilus assembly protein PilF
MTTWNPRANDLFLKARELPAGERRAFLDRECAGDAELRAEVDGLLDAGDRAGGFLEAPALAPEPAPAADHPPPAERPGAVVGPYKLLEQAGEGGFAVVFLAEQTQPVRRKVALKVLKPGMDTKQVVARFEAERQALAVMDHPNIARVFDGGVTTSGRPYFVMELVKGVPITQFCDQNHLTPRQRLELFVSVCSAVQHAHQKGIVHRDLKPSNVLVSRHDTTPVVKVIDFGVAKALGQELTDKTLFTGLAQMVGTPLYMSPEQAGMSDLDVDTRSDIYSLGVLLYELLTGSTPFEKERFKRAAYDEIRRIIREEEPPKPSTRLSASRDTLPSVAAQRQTEAGKLTRLVRGELDWIVMKALEKDRARRYETANGLAADVQRYLHQEPVQAHPPSAAYRLRKFVRRNKGQVIAAGLVILALVLGLAGTTYGLIRAEARRVEAERARAAEAERADGERRATQEALAAKDRAERAEAETLASYRAATDDAIEQLIASRPDLGPREQTYLENTAKRWQALADRAGDDERARAIRAEGHFRVGFLWLKLARVDEARRECGEALAIYEKLADEFPARPEYREMLASSHNHMGILLNELGKQQDVEKQWCLELAIRKKLAEDFPDRPKYRKSLAGSHNNLGIVLRHLGRQPEAEEQDRMALAIYEKLADDFPALPEYHAALARFYTNMGIHLAGAGKRGEAEKQYRRALAIYEKLADEFPTMPPGRQDFIKTDYYLHGLATTHNNLGILLHDLGKWVEAEEQYRLALPIHKKLAVGSPAVPLHRQELARCHIRLVLPLLGLGKPAEAEEQYRLALPILEKLTAEFSAVPVVRQGLAAEWYDFACIYAVVSGKVADKRQEYADRAMELLHQAVQAGWKDAGRMKRDRELDPLRGREDFKKLLAELEKAKDAPENEKSKR